MDTVISQEHTHHYFWHLSFYNTFMLFSVKLPCIVSDWSEWSKPDATGTIYRHRMMTRPALNGGKECPELMQMKKGNH